MKFVNYLERITGVTIYPLISLSLFLLLFLVVGYWALKVNSRYINSMKNMPLADDDLVIENTKQSTHEQSV